MYLISKRLFCHIAQRLDTPCLLNPHVASNPHVRSQLKTTRVYSTDNGMEETPRRPQPWDKDYLLHFAHALKAIEERRNQFCSDCGCLLAEDCGDCSACSALGWPR